MNKPLIECEPLRCPICNRLIASQQDIPGFYICEGCNQFTQKGTTLWGRFIIKTRDRFSHLRILYDFLFVAVPTCYFWFSVFWPEKMFLIGNTTWLMPLLIFLGFWFIPVIGEYFLQKEEDRVCADYRKTAFMPLFLKSENHALVRND